jgi:hypothetical protein
MTEEGIELLNRLERLELERVERNRVRVLEARLDALERRVEELASGLAWVLECSP